MARAAYIAKLDKPTATPKKLKQPKFFLIVFAKAKKCNFFLKNITMSKPKLPITVPQNVEKSAEPEELTKVLLILAPQIKPSKN